MRNIEEVKDSESCRFLLTAPQMGQGLSNRKIATACGIARPTVSEYFRRAEEADLSWPLPGYLTDTHLARIHHHDFQEADFGIDFQQ